MSLVETSSQQPLPRPAERSGRRPERAPPAAESRLATELAEIRELQAISTQLIQEDAAKLHDAILDASLKLLRSDMATMQLYDAAQDGLTLLSSRGFDPEHIKLFDLVARGAGTSCAAALRAGSRVVIPDVECSEFVLGTAEHGALRLCGIRSAQSTPLVSRTGAVIGMITNHWRGPHRPTERALQLVDVLARQAADLIDRNRHEERIVLLAREAEHRAKNMLAAVQAVIRLTQAETTDALKQALAGRINALNNVHRLFVESKWSGADLRTLIAEELAPYCQREDLKADLSGPAVILEPTTAQAVSMTVHELATNAAKYGALSRPGGLVRVTWNRDDAGRITVGWEESGGPALKHPTKPGVGTKVMNTMIQGQLNGTIQFDWRDEGLRCELSLPNL